MILRGWNTEKVMLVLRAPSIAMRGKQFSYAERWESFGTDGFCAWGVTRRHGKIDRIEVMLDLFKIQREDFARGGACSCGQTMPCEHVVGLLLMLVENPQQFERDDPPPWVINWLDRNFQRAKRAYLHRQEGRPLHTSEAEIEARRARRLHRLQGGMQELELWLENLVRHGLVNPRVQSEDFWRSIADRMVDARAPAAASELKSIGQLDIHEEGGVEIALERLSRLYLLAKSFRRYDKLPVEAQADMRAVTGWYDRPEEIAAEAAVDDKWTVFAHDRGNIHDRLREQRVWLYGKFTKRYALLHEFAFEDALFDTYFTTGTAFTGKLVFYPSQYPLRAYVHHIANEGRASTSTAWESIHDCIDRYSQALSTNPWIHEFPCMLQAVIPTRIDEDWVLREEDGTYLPIMPDYADKWVLLALSGGHPIQIGGTWDGASFYPMTAVAENRWVNLKRLENL
ncbi:MAG: hypothetical protein AAF653_07825 [Chloroflexota bacterium]